MNVIRAIDLKIGDTFLDGLEIKVVTFITLKRNDVEITYRPQGSRTVISERKMTIHKDLKIVRA